jgi:hypothetical protein
MNSERQTKISGCQYEPCKIAGECPFLKNMEQTKKLTPFKDKEKSALRRFYYDKAYVEGCVSLEEIGKEYAKQEPNALAQLEVTKQKQTT